MSTVCPSEKKECWKKQEAQWGEIHIGPPFGGKNNVRPLPRYRPATAFSIQLLQVAGIALDPLQYLVDPAILRLPDSD